MKIILIGASGTLGKGIDKELGERHEIVRVGHSSGDFQVDISDSDSIRACSRKPVASTRWSPRSARCTSAPWRKWARRNTSSACATS